MNLFKGREITNKAFQLDSLDGMRGLAALLVILSHTSMVGWYFIPGVDFQGIGKTGVYLFFILSSFLLTYQLISKAQIAFTKDGMLNFALRRTFRVYPLYLFYLLSALVTTMLIAKYLPSKAPDGLPFALDVSEFLSLFFLQEAKGVEWSVVVEFKFYLLLPFLAFTYSIILKNKVFPCFILTILLIVICQNIWLPSSYVTNDSRLGIYAPIFLIGSFLAVIHHWLRNRSNLDSHIQWGIEVIGWAAVAIIVALIPLVARLWSSGDIGGGEFHKEFVLYAFLWSVILFAAIYGRGYIGSFFALKFLRYVGFISFSVYLIHVSIIKMVRVLGLGDILSAWVVLVAVLVLSSITYRLIEQPTSKIKWMQKNGK